MLALESARWPRGPLCPSCRDGEDLIGVEVAPGTTCVRCGFALPSSHTDTVAATLVTDSLGDALTGVAGPSEDIAVEDLAGRPLCPPTQAPVYTEPIPLTDDAGWLTPMGQRLYGLVEYRRRWHEAQPAVGDDRAALERYLSACQDVAIDVAVWSPACAAFGLAAGLAAEVA